MNKLIEQALEEIRVGHPTAYRVLEEFYLENKSPADTWSSYPTFGGGLALQKNKTVDLVLKGCGVGELFSSTDGGVVSTG